VPNSKIFVVGGSDEACKSGYRSKLFDHVVHLDSQIDVKPKFKHQIDDRDKKGNFLFAPQFFEHHRSYLREVYEDKVGFKPLKSLTFFGVQGQHVSQDDIDLVESQKEKIEQINVVFYSKDIVGQKVKLFKTLPTKEKTERSMACIDLTCMKARFAPGVSEPNVCQGLSLRQLKTAIKDLSDLRHNDLVCLAEYNPAIEQVKTGQTIVEIFEQLLVRWVDCAKESRPSKKVDGVEFKSALPKDFDALKRETGSAPKEQESKAKSSRVQFE